MITPVPTEWWLRPVRRAARVGEQSAVVWKRLYRKPSRANRSSTGVAAPPPNVDACPKPVSSVRMRRTLGAPSGATRGLGKSGLDCCHVCPICPANGVAERGKTVLESSPVAPDMDCPCADADSVIIRAVAARRLRRIIRTSMSRPSRHYAGGRPSCSLLALYQRRHPARRSPVGRQSRQTRTFGPTMHGSAELENWTWDQERGK